MISASSPLPSPLAAEMSGRVAFRGYSHEPHGGRDDQGPIWTFPNLWPGRRDGCQRRDVKSGDMVSTSAPVQMLYPDFLGNREGGDHDARCTADLGANV